MSQALPAELASNRAMTYPRIREVEKKVALALYESLVDLFETPDTWTRGWFACMKDGRTCGPCNPRAAQWSLDGAVARAAEVYFKGNAPRGTKKEYREWERSFNMGWSLVCWTLIDAIWQNGWGNVDHIRGPIQHFNDYDDITIRNVLEVVYDGLKILDDMEVMKERGGGERRRRK